MDGRKKGSDFGIRTYFDMFQKMEDTFKFCAECKKLPDALPDPKSLRRCKRYGRSSAIVWGWMSPGSQKGKLSPGTRVEAGGARPIAGSLAPNGNAAITGWLSGCDPGHPQSWACCLSPSRCQNVYYCSVACQRANWPVHKKFCKKLKLVALDRLVEWLIFTGGSGDAAPTPCVPHSLTPGRVRSLLLALVTPSWLCHYILQPRWGQTALSCRTTTEMPLFCPQVTFPSPRRPGQNPLGMWQAGRTGSPCRSSWRRSWTLSWLGAT